MGVVIEQGFGRDEDAGSAVAALGRAQLGEGGLQWMRRAALGQAFDRQNLAALKFNRQREAGEGRFAIHEHGARAALAQLAAVFRAGEIQILAQHFEQGLVNLNPDFVIFAVDSESDELFHVLFYLPVNCGLRFSRKALRPS